MAKDGFLKIFRKFLTNYQKLRQTVHSRGGKRRPRRLRVFLEKGKNRLRPKNRELLKRNKRLKEKLKNFLKV